ncbi:hypothetical protein [Mumia sp. Pv 4-285]|uniref:hypothetical protein n=1 Tax=Mumia qirimensis TaxID=3234852 RepID=UPI00351D96B7
MSTPGYTEPLAPTTPTARADEGGAKENAQAAAATAADESRRVGSVAKDEAANVVGEAKDQAANLIDQARTELDEQSHVQRDRLVRTLRSFTDDLDQMTDRAEPGMAANLARQTSGRVRDLTDVLERREPVELLDDVRDFARRRPGTFLLGALAAGVVAGRLVRGAKAANGSDDRTSTTDVAPVYEDTDVAPVYEDVAAQTPAAPVTPVTPGTMSVDPVTDPAASELPGRGV